MYCSDCDLDMMFVATRERDDQIFDFFQCIRCGKPNHSVRYKYTPSTCPRHFWEFIGTAFKDDPHCHTITHLARCDRCGAIREIPRDTRQAGLSGRVEIEDPRVKRTLLLNRDSWKRRIPKELQDLRSVPLPKEVILPREV